MTGIAVKIKSTYKDFTVSERRVADYILINEEVVPFQTVYEIAGAVKVSVPTISRLIKKVGYQSFKDFKIELAKDSQTTIGDIYSAITPKDDDEVLIDKVFTGNMKSIEDTLKAVKKDDLVEASKSLSKAKRIVFFGIGGSGIVAADASLRFSHLNIQAESYSDPIQILIQAKRLKGDSVAVGITHSGRSSIIINAMKAAKANGAVTIGISNYLNKSIKNASQYLFCTSFEETQVKVAALSSNIAQLCLIDAMYLIVAKHTKKLWNLEELNEFIESSLRIKD